MKASALLTSAFGIVVIFTLALYGSAPLLLPQPAPATTLPDQFSAERAMVHIQALAQAPRVAGSPEMGKTADYLMETLHAYGVNPQIQESPSAKGILHNVIVRIPGSDSSRALLFLTHSDSVSFGAGDNASGVAVLLETARALQAGPQPKNDIILLFDDGEEEGYWGGYAFAQAQPWVKDIQCVIGLDTAAWGPVVLLQTTPGNNSLVRFYAASVSNPTAYGFYADADWNLSHDTSEIQPFFERGLPGMALEDPTAFIGKHSTDDTVEHILPGSLQQMGEQTLALARSFGDSYQPQASGSDLSYFTLWGIGVIRFPAFYNIIMVFLAAIGLVALIVFGIKRKTITGRSIPLSLIFLFLATLLAGLVGVGGNTLFELLFPNPNPNIGSYLNDASLPFLLVDLAVVILIYWLIRIRLVRRWGAFTVALGGLLVWLLFAAVFLAVLRIGSYLIAIPLLAAVLTFFLPARWKMTTVVPAAIATILFAPNIVLAFLSTGMQTLMLVNVLVIFITELWLESRWELRQVLMGRKQSRNMNHLSRF